MIYYVISIFAILFLLVVARLVIKEQLLTKYSVLWLAFGIILIAASFCVDGINVLAHILNVHYAPSIIFLFGIFFLMIYTLHLSIVATKQSKYITNITQDLAIVKEKLERLEKKK